MLNDTFLELLGTENYLAPIPAPPYKPIHPDSLIDVEEEISLEDADSLPNSVFDSEYKAQLLEEYERFDWKSYQNELKEYEEYIRNRPVDTSNLIVIVHDTLVDYRKGKFLESILTESGFKHNFNVEPNWRSLAILLVDSLNTPKRLPISKITKTGKYHLVDEKEFVPTKNDRIIGYIQFSRVALNEQKNRACFIFTFNCGRLCGFGNMVFVKKMNGKWKIIGQRELWVS